MTSSSFNKRVFECEKIIYTSHSGSGKTPYQILDGYNNFIKVREENSKEVFYIQFFIENRTDLENLEKTMGECYKEGVNFKYQKRWKKIDVDEYFGEKGVR